MTLRELLQSVDAEAYTSVPLYDELLNTKPEYGSGIRIEVKLVNGEIVVSNVHVGSSGDIEGDSMRSISARLLPKGRKKDAGIFGGDRVIIDRAVEPHNGSIVVAGLD